jgi:hypothetical protein
MTLTLDSETIRRYAEKYHTENTTDDEDEMLASLPAKFRDGTVNWDDYVRIIRWKTGGRALPYFERNDREYVDHIIELIVQSMPASWKIRHLGTLDGVKAPTASAFLTFIDPERYTVIDYRAWGVLHNCGILREPPANTYDDTDYTEYLRTCRSVADDYDVGLRTLDRALFEMYDEL